MYFLFFDLNSFIEFLFKGRENIQNEDDMMMPEAIESPNLIGNISKPEYFKCMPACTVQENQVHMSYGTYPQKANFFYQVTFCHVASHIWQISCQNPSRKNFLEINHPGICMVLEENQEYFSNEIDCEDWPNDFFEENYSKNELLNNIIYEYGSQNLALVHVLIQSPYITVVKRDVEMSFISYVANTGGLLGLCLGFSFISGIEILFWCCCCFKQFQKIFKY